MMERDGMKILAMTWEEVQSLLADLSAAISRDYSPDLVVGIARGGYVIARVLSDLLGVSEVAVVGIGSYAGPGKKFREPRITQHLPCTPQGRRILLVDDIADTGGTLLLAKGYLNGRGAAEVRTATIHLRPGSKTIPDYYVNVTDDWVMYPWEARETITALIKSWSGIEGEDLRERLVAAGVPREIVDRYMPGLCRR